MRIVQGNLLDQKGILVQQVNTLGVAGAGLALQIANKWPDWLQSYQQYTKHAVLGDVFLFIASREVLIASIYGQATIGRIGKHTNYTALEIGFEYVAQIQHCLDYKVFIPTGIGCGLGGGDWSRVKHLIELSVPYATLVAFKK